MTKAASVSTTPTIPAPEFAAAIDSFRSIAAASGERLLLSDGPPHPDAELLQLCADALHLLIEAECASRGRPITTLPPGAALSHADRAEDRRLLQLSQDNRTRARPLLRAIRKLAAKNAAGIYAKAMVVRASRTGAELLAMSLAQDLIACPGLRAALWPAAGDLA